ncbi:hypothetical protein EG329_000231 [Mollisiaceae sp. DMI_Dod_QoI]|nr:hypothetical protein EG329_000231 [Helotiales sp. DMI_Dod_QoI]
MESVVNLDFDARVPIPFSVFPSSYRSDEQQTTTQTHVEGEIKLPQAPSRVGRDGQYSSYAATLPPPRDDRFQGEEVVHITREEERHHRPSRREDIYIRDERRPTTSQTQRPSAHIDFEVPNRRRDYKTTYNVDIEAPRPQRRQYAGTDIDVAEREYRSRVQPSYREDIRVAGATVDPPRFQPSYREEVRVSGTTVDPPRPQSTFREEVRITGTTIDPPRPQSTYREEVRVSGSTVDPPTLRKPIRDQVRFTEETVDPARYSTQPIREEVRVSKEIVESPSHFSKAKMGYYDEDGHYHSFRHGLHRAADRVLGRHHHHHVDREEIDITIAGPRSETRAAAEPAYTPNTVTIPCHHIRLGDLLILQGRPCQVIRITTSAATGQHRYLGVDLFTKQLHEESSFISNPSPSVVVQTMLGPVFKQYRVLDLQDGQIVAMTETGDVKQSLPVIDQSNLWGRLTEAFESGRGSVRVMVISDQGRELAVDMKTIHGSRL